MYITGHTLKNKFYALPIETGEQGLRFSESGALELSTDHLNSRHPITISWHKGHLTFEIEDSVDCYVNGIKKNESFPVMEGDELMIQGFPLKVVGDIKSILFSERDTIFVKSHTAPLIEQSLSHFSPGAMFSTSDNLSHSLLTHLEKILNSGSKFIWKEHLFKALSELFAFDRIYLFLFDTNRQQFNLYDTYLKDRHSEPKSSLLSQTLLNYVLKTKKAVFSKDLLSDPRFKDSESLMNNALSSLICIPLLTESHISGIVYGDSNHIIRDQDRVALEELIMICRQASIVLENLELHEQIEEKNNQIQENFKSQFPFIGKSNSIAGTLNLVKRVAPTNMNILITGETGTGKELIAHMIHQHSYRNRKPLEIVNCGAIPEHLWESEMFGFEKGAFTGATSLKKGRFEVPDGGTLFLDEIGEMPLTMQAKLLRFLQDQIIQRIGGHKPVKVNVRIIAATNRNLEQDVHKGSFREDLFYRLNAMRIEIPPLRERLDDIDSLISFFIERFCDELHRIPPEITKESRDILKTYGWPGNIRELKNVIERALVIADGNFLKPEHFQLNEGIPVQPLVTPLDHKLNYKEAFEGFESQYLQQLLANARGNVTQASELAGMDRSHLHQKLKKYGLISGHFK